MPRRHEKPAPDTGRTRLPERALVELRAHGHRSRARFVDPYVLQTALSVIERRGKDWVESVLGRPIDRRSRIDCRVPWLFDGEQYTLMAADRAEDKLATARILGLD
jgi:hypothetical protein